MSLSLGLQLTTRCNLRCAHCYQNGALGEDMPMGLLTRVFDAAQAAGCDCLDFTGGEPLLHPAWPDMLHMLAERNLGFSLVTNGWNLEGFVRSLRPSPSLLRHLSISLDGPDAETHDGVRASGSFARATAAARVCRDVGAPFAIRMTITRASRPHLDRMLALSEMLGAKALVLIPLIPTQRTADAKLLPEPADLQAVAGWAADRPADAATRVVLAAGFFTLETARPCPSFTAESLFVTVRGDIVFCCQLVGDGERGADLLGHVHDTPLADAKAHARELADAITREKQAKARTGELGYLEHHPCWYCLKRFRRAGWLAAYPGSSWAADVQCISGAIP